MTSGSWSAPAHRFWASWALAVRNASPGAKQAAVLPAPVRWSPCRTRDRSIGNKCTDPQTIRRDYFANRVFDSLNAATLQAESGLARLAFNRKALKSLTNWPWINAILNTR